MGWSKGKLGGYPLTSHRGILQTWGGCRGEDRLQSQERGLCGHVCDPQQTSILGLRKLDKKVPIYEGE